VHSGPRRRAAAASPALRIGSEVFRKAVHSRPAPKPSTGAWTGNSIDVTASATDNAGLASLKFFGNGTQFAQVTCSGTTCGSTQWWLTGSLPSGKHTITVVATDTAGNSTTSAPVVINK
jgi:hypothetical protein